MVSEAPSWRPPDRLLRWAAISLCALAIAGAAVAGALLLARLRLVLVPVVVATFLTRALAVPADALGRRGWPARRRASVVLLGFLAVLAAITWIVAPPLAAEVDDLGPTLQDGIDQVEDWLVRDAPIDLDRQQLQDLEDRAVDQLRSAAAGGGGIVERAQVALETVAGLVLALLLTLFALKDGEQLQRWALHRVPRHRRDEATRMAAAGWAALGGYLRGAALLGVVEAVIIGGTLAVVGSSLVLPVALLTFVGAFLPIVGATLAGAAAVLTALVTAGTAEAGIVLVVAVLVQQFDNDLLAPWIYGRTLQLHPAVILLSITTGTALFGFAGAVLAVPVVAAVVGAVGARDPEGAEALSADDP
ncbi:MAG: AI-2E family transporter [Acidimicrobiales bacterium]|nr:AI-2E family transporter [Acidimicrobiales bacterium]HRW37297.1 AI-2E family transporter [Aquihabitans sp.]